jgi:hypothetical protein
MDDDVAKGIREDFWSKLQKTGTGILTGEKDEPRGSKQKEFQDPNRDTLPSPEPTRPHHPTVCARWPRFCVYRTSPGPSPPHTTQHPTQHPTPSTNPTSIQCRTTLFPPEPFRITSCAHLRLCLVNSPTPLMTAHYTLQPSMRMTSFDPR